MTFDEKVSFAKKIIEKLREIDPRPKEPVPIRLIRRAFSRKDQKLFDAFFNETFRSGGLYHFIARVIDFEIYLTTVNKCFAWYGYQDVAGEQMYYIKLLPYTRTETYDELVELYGDPHKRKSPPAE